MNSAGRATIILVLAVPPSAAVGGEPSCRYEENCGCAAPGITVRWKAAYCLHASETDDVESGPVQACLARKDPRSVAKRSACEQNAYWKARLCRAMHGKEDAVRGCIRDRSMIPRIVDKGAGG